MNKKPVIVITGPTAAGKTDLAIRLAKKISGEIISADSIAAYKGMDIISQKPSKRELKAVPHHLVSFLNPREEYSVAIFSKIANERIKDIIEKKKIPIVVGGSGLYVKALVSGIFPSKGKDVRVRLELERIAGERGASFLHKRLKKIDPVSAETIHPNDARRIMRALEIYEVDKKTKTSLRAKTKGIKDEYDVKLFGLTMERDKLYERINRRVDLMFKKGIVREVKRVLRRRLSMTARQALGIKEVEGYLNGSYDIERAKYLLKRNTRHFAKRQFTWFRADKSIVWLDAESLEGTFHLDLTTYR